MVFSNRIPRINNEWEILGLSAFLFFISSVVLASCAASAASGLETNSVSLAAQHVPLIKITASTEQAWDTVRSGGSLVQLRLPRESPQTSLPCLPPRRRLFVAVLRTTLPVRSSESGGVWTGCIAWERVSRRMLIG